MIFRRSAFLFLLCVVALAGCNNEKNRNLIDRRADQAIRMGEEAQNPAPPRSYDPLVVTNKIWAGDNSIKLRSGKPLPMRLETARGVTLIVSDPQPLSEIATAIGAQTGIPVRIASDMMGGAMMMSANPMGGTMPVAYEGPLSGLLDLVSGHFGMNWSYDGAAINLSRFETRIFTVQTLPGELSIKDGMGDMDDGSGSSSSSSSAGGSYSASSSSSLKQSAEMNVEMKVWDEIDATIKGILGGMGSVVTSPSSGTVTVTTTPEIMRTVAKFISEENERLSHQIAINVEIYSVTLEDGDDFDVSLSTAFANMGDFNVNIGDATGPAASSTLFPSMGSLSMAILTPEGKTRVGGVFKALSSIGDATRVAQFPMTTLNNRPVSRRIGRDRTYVASLSADTSTSTDFSSSTVTPGTVREGFSLQLTPRLLDDGRIMLQYSLSLIDIVQMVDFATGVGNIQLPETSSRVFVQQSLLRSGSTLVIGGFDDEQTSQSSQGVGSPYNYFFGGGSSNTKSRTMMFIAVTPQVIDISSAERL